MTGFAAATFIGPLFTAHVEAASGDDIAQSIVDGRLGDALAIAERALAQDQGSASVRLMVGVLRFAHGDYVDARRLLEGGDLAGGYLMGGPLDEDALRTHINGDDWRYLASLRAGESASGGVSPRFSQILSGEVDVDTYAAQQAVRERSFYDALVLSIASSPGRATFLDSAAARARSQHSCSAHFVLAEVALAEERTADATDSLRTATATDQPELLEYHIAKAELARLG